MKKTQCGDILCTYVRSIVYVHVVPIVTTVVQSQGNGRKSITVSMVIVLLSCFCSHNDDGSNITV